MIQSDRQPQSAQKGDRAGIEKFKAGEKGTGSMKIEFKKMEEKELANFKGGEKVFRPKKFDDGSAKIMYGTLEPGASIGLHRHEGNSEIIYVLAGVGTMLYDGEEELLYPGDAHYCPEGHIHSFINKGTEDLVFFAVVPELSRPETTQAEAKEEKKEKTEAAQEKSTASSCYAFVDGSYNKVTKVYGYGGFLVHDGKKEILQGSGSDAEMASMHNVAGEILGSTAAIQKAIALGIPEIKIYYDYMGIEKWATGGWKRNKKGTIAYYDFIQSVKDQIKIEFVKVKGHSGVEGNEEADRLAKEAAGI